MEETLVTAARRVIRCIRIDDANGGGLLSRETIIASDTLDKMIRLEAKKQIAKEIGPRPIAWSYELASAKDNDGRYITWSYYLTSERPNVPEGSIRNLTPLYSQEQLTHDIPSGSPV